MEHLLTLHLCKVPVLPLTKMKVEVSSYATGPIFLVVNLSSGSFCMLRHFEWFMKEHY
jgi:hypothetical protein